MYEIYLGRTAEKDLKKLDKTLFKRIIIRIKELSKNPHPRGCKKIVGSENDWRIRIGDYRIIYEIDESLKRVVVMRVKPRGSAYSLS